MIVFPNAKINIGLQIKGKRADGYHHLETIFYPIQLCDALECISPSTEQELTSINISGLPVEGNETDNLCLKAYQLLKNQYPTLPPVNLFLHKAIPMGAGLGGGSADAAFTLKLLCSFFSIDATSEQLMAWSLVLGSDCPFFILNKPCFAEGRGEIMSPIELDSLKNCSILLVNPGINVSTAWAFQNLQRKEHTISLTDAIQYPIPEWKYCIENDFEDLVCSQHPTLSKLKNQLYDAGAIYASMSGSGSSFYGIFPESVKPVIQFPTGYFSKWV